MFIFKNNNYIKKLNYYNRKIRQTLRTIYGTTEHLFWPYLVSEAVYTVIFHIGDGTSDHRAEIQPLCYWPTSHTSDTKLTSQYTAN